MPSGRVWLAPAVPAGLGDLRIERLTVGGARMTVAVTDGAVETTGLPPGVEVAHAARPAVPPERFPSTDRTS